MTNVVIFQYVEGRLMVLLTSSSDNPKQPWRLPSSTVNTGQTSLQSLEAALRGTVGLDHESVTYREQLYTTETISGRQSLVYINYLYLCRDLRWHKGSQHVGLFPVDTLPTVLPDDAAMVRYGLERLAAKTFYTSILSFLLPKTFDLTDLQRAFETITGQSVDRRNFRKKITQLDVVTHVTIGQQTPTQPQRYRFKRANSLVIYRRPFPPRPGAD